MRVFTHWIEPLGRDLTLCVSLFAVGIAISLNALAEAASDPDTPGQATTTTTDDRKPNLQRDASGEVDPPSMPARTAEQDALANRLVHSALITWTECDAHDIPLTDLLTFFQEAHHIAIEIDPLANNEIAEFDINTVTLRCKRQSLEYAIMLALGKSELSYLVEDGRLLITTKDEVRRRGHTLPMGLTEVLKQLENHSNIPWEFLLRGEILAGVPGPETDGEQLEQRRQLLQRRSVIRLTALLANDDPFVQINAARCLSCFGERAKVAIPNLLKLTNSNDVQLRRAVYSTLAAICETDISTLPTFIDAWQRDPEIRNDWIVLVSAYGSARFDEFERVYLTAAADFRLAIIQSSLFSHPTEAMNLWLLGMKDSDPRICRHVTRVAIRQCGRVTEEMIDPLRDQMQNPDKFVRIDAAASLLSLESESGPAFDYLSRVFASEDLTERSTAAKVFCAAHGAAHRDDLLRRLSEFFTSAEEPARTAAFEALGVMDSQFDENQTPISFWGPVASHRRTRLSLPLGIIKNGPLVFRLEVEGIEGNSPVDGDQANELTGTLRILDPDGTSIQDVEFDFPPSPGPNKSSPKVIMLREVTFDEKRIPLNKAGRYRIQFAGNGIPPSNVTTLIVLEAASKD